MAIWPWKREKNGAHAPTKVEQSSAELVGKLELLCEELEELVTAEEQRIQDDEDE